MTKLGIIIDSSTGLTKKEAEKRNWGFLPLTLILDDIEYLDGIEISKKEYYEKLKTSKKFQTATSIAEKVIEVYKEFSQKYDKVVVLTISNKLSSQNELCKKIAHDFPNIFVPNSNNILNFGVVIAEEIEKLANSKATWEDILQFIKRNNDSAFGYAIPYTLDNLVKGGRIPPTLAKIANLAKIVPIIKFENGKLERGPKGRVFEKTFVKVLKMIRKEVDSEEISNNHKIIVSVYQAGYDDLDFLQKNVQKYLGTNVEILHIAPIVANHLGIKSLVVARQKIVKK